MKELLIALCLLISWTCSLASYSPVYHLLSGTLYVGISNCFMSAYFTDLLFVYHFSQYIILLSMALYVSTSNCWMSTYFTGMFFLYLFHGLTFIFFGIIHGHASCLPFSRYTILLPGK